MFNETIAGECSTSHMVLQLCWFLCMRTGSSHGPWNSLVLYLGETTGVQPASTTILQPTTGSLDSTGRLVLDFTSCYRFSPNYTHLTCQNVIWQRSAITDTTVKQHPLDNQIIKKNWDCLSAKPLEQDKAKNVCQKRFDPISSNISMLDFSHISTADIVQIALERPCNHNIPCKHLHMS